ncbi:cytochrome c oxidase subunit 5B mitochondrial [Echinococcus multilocularis]|uniref:Cytochrome c oxidase subunit 5B mitochondrial n=1 Tax=Echinococcus multilocularis TaxID=6211 RepID=A0A068YB04_ECHMU|nr:cytochrome c oxidase subunit 5B mitochondrial [Echinococcus multilocularis]
MICKVSRSNFPWTAWFFRSFSTMNTSEGKQLKCLSEAVKSGDYVAVEKIIIEQDPYEVRRVKMPTITSADEPNIIASTSDTRLIGCLCEPQADAINWMEISKGEPRQCYCGHWFRLVDFEEYLSLSDNFKQLT